MDKRVSCAAEAIADIPEGAFFGVGGIPSVLMHALYEQGAGNLRAASNNCGVEGIGLGILLDAERIARATGSYVGENAELARQYLSGELELVPRGTLAERLRAGGCGITAFYTPAGVGTQVADGGPPWRYGRDGGVETATPAKEIRSFDGTDFVLEYAITTDFALVGAARGDRHGNLVFARSARNFNPLVAMPGGSRSPRSKNSSSPAHSTPTRCTCPACSSSASSPSPRRRPLTCTSRNGASGGPDRPYPGSPARAATSPTGPSRAR
jgi:3-oxoacid CoA-transferase subunit A